MTAAIVGWAHTPFGKHTEETVESLIVKVARDAIADAGLEAGDVDEIVLGHFNAGFSEQDFTASLVLQADPALRFKKATNKMMMSSASKRKIMILMCVPHLEEKLVVKRRTRTTRRHRKCLNRSIEARLPR